MFFCEISSSGLRERLLKKNIQKGVVKKKKIEGYYGVLG